MTFTSNRPNWLECCQEADRHADIAEEAAIEMPVQAQIHATLALAYATLAKAQK